ncbi:MAG: hypothetical protein WDA75_15775 [Candidatus Latescibacterota bacterium]
MPRLPGDLSGHLAWWEHEGRHLLLVQTWEEGRGRAHVATVDPATGELLGEWSRDADDEPGGDFLMAPGGGFYYYTFTRLFKADVAGGRLVQVAVNPTPAECRCLAISPSGLLGTDTYDLGYAFTLDRATGLSRSHGKVWADDHRANHGPAAFAGRRGRSLLANHGEAMPGLWATDTRTNAHCRIGEAAVQLVRFGDGSVWGTQGPNPASIAFDPQTCWTPSWSSRLGRLFRYWAGSETVILFSEVGQVGPIAEAPGRAGRLLAAVGRELLILEVAEMQVLERVALPGECVAMTGAGRRRSVYLLLADGALLHGRGWRRSVRLQTACTDFGRAERGLMVLPQSGAVVGIALDGQLSVWRPGNPTVTRLSAPSPPPAGPAVDPAEDAWYYADRVVTRFTLEG